jgi:hypothetical protein
MKRPSRLPYLRHNLAQFNRDTDRQARKRTPWLGFCALVVWSASLYWVASQECEYRHQRERLMREVEASRVGDSVPLSPGSEGYGARIVNETPAGLSLEF